MFKRLPYQLKLNCYIYQLKKLIILILVLVNCFFIFDQLQTAQQKIEELNKEQESLIDIFSEERDRRDNEERNLRQKLLVSYATLGSTLVNTICFLQSPLFFARTCVKWRSLFSVGRVSYHWGIAWQGKATRKGEVAE